MRPRRRHPARPPDARAERQPQTAVVTPDAGQPTAQEDGRGAEEAARAARQDAERAEEERQAREADERQRLDAEAMERSLEQERQTQRRVRERDLYLGLLRG